MVWASNTSSLELNSQSATSNQTRGARGRGAGLPTVGDRRTTLPSSSLLYLAPHSLARMTIPQHFPLAAKVPVYCLDWIAEDVLVFAGGGGKGRTGVGNYIVSAACSIQ